MSRMAVPPPSTPPGVAPTAATRPAAAAQPAAGRPPARPADRSVGYIEASSYPLTSLWFVAPLMVVYEVGTRLYVSDPVSHVQQRIVAFNLMQKFFELWGASGQWMPAGAVASILLAWHLARGDRWAARPGVLAGMAAESVMYAVPLVALGYVLQHCLPLRGLSPTGVSLYPAPVAPAGTTQALLVLSIGAGVYEELVFRLVAFTVLNFLLVDLCRMPRLTAIPLMVVTSAVAFSLYHYKPSGIEPFQWESFLFRTLAGIYFGLVFACRGFGLTAGAHAGYDVAIVLLRAFPAA